MPTVLSEYAKLSTDILLKGVVETIIKDSPLLQKLPFIEITGNAMAYNREKSMTAAAFYAVDGAWASPPAVTFDKLTAELKILGQDADVDNYVKATRSNVQEIETTIIELTANSVRRKFENTFIYGTTSAYLGLSAEAEAFDGVWKLLDTGTANGQVVSMGGTGGTLTLAKLDELIDTVKGGKPDLLMMSRRSRRKLNALMRAAGTVEIGQDEFGNFITLYNGIPVAINDWILDTHTLATGVETATTGGANSVIYALSFGEGAVCGIIGPGALQVEPVGTLESKDATRTRIKWYVSLADFCQQKRGALIGVQD
jgi:hypothetical protein